MHMIMHDSYTYNSFFAKVTLFFRLQYQTKKYFKLLFYTNPKELHIHIHLQWKGYI